MKKLSLITALTFSFIATSFYAEAQKGLPEFVPESAALQDTITRMDSLFFDAYNTCKMGVIAAFISEDLEFYHDHGGLSTSKKDLLAGLKANICGKVTRELLKGSIEVYPIPGYGAIEMGVHRFHNNQEPADAPFHYSKFVHTWKRTGTQWQLTRVISLH